MSYIQKVTPNLDPIVTQPDQQGKPYRLTSWLSYCLATVQFAFNADYTGSYAQGCWNANVGGGNHADRNIPVGVYVPIFFSGYKGQGHVMFIKLNQDGSGTAWTSPRTNKPYFDVLNFTNLDNLIAQMQQGWSKDLVYLGWSEFVGPTRVIEFKGDDEVLIQDTDNEYGRWALLSVQCRIREDKDGNVVPLTRDEFRQFGVGRTWLAVIEIFQQGQEFLKALEKGRVGTLALRDNWSQKVTDLVQVTAIANIRANYLENLRKAAGLPEGVNDQQLVDALAVLIKGDESLKQQLKDAQVKAAQYQNQQAADTQSADTFLRRLGQFITKYLPGGK